MVNQALKNTIVSIMIILLAFGCGIMYGYRFYAQKVQKSANEWLTENINTDCLKEVNKPFLFNEKLIFNSTKWQNNKNTS